ncbi:C39 family peptidase [Fictibacillus sp. Mic-4]|uniref:C39 family peptidase n=1 Tax=Fictibacillus sp. Mic-4 TaxID=3132826 RepID=UPI003CED9B0B
MKKLAGLLVLSFLIGAGVAFYKDNTAESKQETEKVLSSESKEAVPASSKTKEAPPSLSKTERVKASSSSQKRKKASSTKQQTSYRLSVPKIKQLPELARGCEVTSLAMLLNDAGVKVGKMELAKKIKKDHTPYEKKDGVTYYGNPNDGFLGNIYDLNEMGYGVYHRPVADLARQYMPGRIKDLTGQSFDSILSSLKKGRPVWTIINAQYRKLPESAFRTWHTPSGKVKITWYEHAVVLTGFDDKYVYFNDPLDKDSKAPRNDFKEAWEQMGRQAITYK